MRPPALGTPDYTEADLDFVITEAAPGATDTERLKRLIREDEEFRKALVGDEKVFEGVMNDEEVFLRISPSLYFEVLLRRALKELVTATHTTERSGSQSIPVFDVRDLVDLLSGPKLLEYLAQMLASFTKVHSYVASVRVRRGVRRRVRHNDMDIDSLLRLCASADERDRLSFYKRIADVCLFVSGVFPKHATYESRFPASGQPVPRTIGRLQRSLEDYETEGRRFYGLAQQHPTAQTLDLSDVFGLLRQHFTSARKPLSFIATHYLHPGRHQPFSALTS